MTLKQFLNKMSITSLKTINEVELLEQSKTVQILDYTSIRTGNYNGFENYKVYLFAIEPETLLIYIGK